MQSQSFNSKSIAYGPVIVRIALAIPLVVSGAGKLLGIGPKASGIAGFAGTLASLGIPVPELFAWIVGAVEFGGGLLILLGLFTRYAAALAAVNMAVATVLVHAPNGFVVGEGGFEYTLVLALVAVSLVVSGPGSLSLGRAVFGHELVPSSLRGERAEPGTEA